MPATLPPLALYVHLPWCVQKCPYCDFNSHGLRDGALPETTYTEALLSDMRWEAEVLGVGRPLVSVFFGGGTPSLFSPSSIAAVLEAADRAWGLASDCEITLEANPGTADAAHFSGYRAAGVNRLSLGVQSFDDAQLRRLGRIHDGAAAQHAYSLARKAGFGNINLDLMFALPEQSMTEAAADLETAIALGPEHLSYYHLTLEPNTAFAAAPPPLPDEDTAADMLDAGGRLLQAAGYAGYETSAWAQPGRRCRHNRVYWSFGDYIGIGAGAHGKHSARGADGSLLIERRIRWRHPKQFMAGAGSAEALQSLQPVVPQARPFEFAMNALRLHEGFDWESLAAHAGLCRDDLAVVLEAAQRRGLLSVDQTGVRPTALGRAHLNTLLQLFLEPA
ncbi:radical SAM family heme chaperone HemW [Algiphilus sp.]|uniref:radical SAM family heme chaperone HemW n=1 Tax=Algiphilus sp. TaxID=1872431 RepID=UPI003B52057F